MIQERRRMDSAEDSMMCVNSCPITAHLNLRKQLGDIFHGLSAAFLLWYHVIVSLLFVYNEFLLPWSKASVVSHVRIANNTAQVLPLSCISVYYIIKQWLIAAQELLLTWVAVWAAIKSLAQSSDHRSKCCQTITKLRVCYIKTLRGCSWRKREDTSSCNRVIRNVVEW